MKWWSWLIVLAVALAASLGVIAQNMPTGAAAANGAVAPSVHALQAPGISNFFQLSDKVYSGSAPDDDAGFAALQARGIKTIITVDGAKPDVAAAKKFGLRYVHLPIGYDSVPDKQALRLIKAVETLPGPVFIHCHHGLHRGPSAAAVVCMATDGWTPDQAVAWLHLVGTDTNYAGLYRTVHAFQLPTADTLQLLANDFPETAAVSPLADQMIDLDARLDKVKLTRAAGYKAPAAHPDLDPTEQALLLHEQFKELVRSPLMKPRAQDFKDKLTTAEEAANSYHLSLIVTPFNPKRSDADFQHLTDSCAACHAVYRN